MEVVQTIWSFLLLFSTLVFPQLFGVFAQAKSKEQVIEIPFEFYKNEIILQVNVNGKGPFNMMLDTGTDPSGVDLTTARDIGLKLHPLGKPASGGGIDVNPTYG